MIPTEVFTDIALGSDEEEYPARKSYPVRKSYLVRKVIHLYHGYHRHHHLSSFIIIIAAICAIIIILSWRKTSGCKSRDGGARNLQHFRIFCPGNAHHRLFLQVKYHNVWFCIVCLPTSWALVTFLARDFSAKFQNIATKLCKKCCQTMLLFKFSFSELL